VRMLLNKPAGEVTSAEHMAHNGYEKWMPKERGSSVLVRWFASSPWGPWHMVNPPVRKRPLKPRPVKPPPRSDGVVAHY